MVWLIKTAKCLALSAVIGLLAANTYAGLIDVGTAYDGWKGTTTFQSTSNPDLKGSVDWIVYKAADFPFSGYTPTSGELVYVYQVFSTGKDHISSYSVILDNLADSIGAFSDSTNGITGQAPISMVLTPLDSAHWQFAGINQGENSEGLVYCSPNKPEDYYSIVVNGGSYAIADPIPSPSSAKIPEPGTLLLLMTALGVLAVMKIARRR